MARSNDVPPDPQLAHPAAAADSVLDADIFAAGTFIDRSADQMASKALRTEHTNESQDTTGGVRSNSGGIFSK